MQFLTKLIVGMGVARTAVPRVPEFAKEHYARIDTMYKTIESVGAQLKGKAPTQLTLDLKGLAELKGRLLASEDGKEAGDVIRREHDYITVLQRKVDALRHVQVLVDRASLQGASDAHLQTSIANTQALLLSARDIDAIALTMEHEMPSLTEEGDE